MLLLDVQGDGHGPVEELPDLLEVLLDQAPGSHGRSSNSYTSRCQGTAVAKNSILVHGNIAEIAKLLDLVAGQSKRTKVPKNKVVLSSTSHKLVAFAHEVVPKSNSIGPDLLSIGLESRRHGLLQGNSQSANLVVVRATLKRGENREVDLVLKVVYRIRRLPLLGRLRALPVEDHTGSRTPQALVGCGRDDVTVLKWVGSFLSGDEAADVGHVAEEEGAALVGDGAEAGVVPVAGVGAAAADDEAGAEVEGLLLELVVVDVAGGGVDLVGEALEVDGGGGDLLPPGGVVAVGEVAAGGEVEAHDAVVGLEDGGVGGEVGGGAGVGLDVDAPGGGVEAVGLEGAGAAEVLDLVDVLVAAVVAVAGHALGVLVGEGGAQGLDDREGGEVLRRDQLDPPALPPLLLLDQVVDVRIHRLQRRVAPCRDGIHGNGACGEEKYREREREVKEEVESAIFELGPSRGLLLSASLSGGSWRI